MVDGYTADQDKANSIKLTPTQEMPEDQSITVSYTAIPVDYTITPISPNGQLIEGLSPITLNGTTDTPVVLPEIDGYTPDITTATVPGDGSNVDVLYIPNPKVPEDAPHAEITPMLDEGTKYYDIQTDGTPEGVEQAKTEVPELGPNDTVDMVLLQSFPKNLF